MNDVSISETLITSMVSKTSKSNYMLNTATEERTAQRLGKFCIKVIVLVNDAPNESGDFDL